MEDVNAQRIARIKAVLERLKVARDEADKGRKLGSTPARYCYTMLDIEIARIEVLLLTHQTAVGDGSWGVYSFGADVLDE